MVAKGLVLAQLWAVEFLKQPMVPHHVERLCSGTTCGTHTGSQVGDQKALWNTWKEGHQKAFVFHSNPKPEGGRCFVLSTASGGPEASKNTGISGWVCSEGHQVFVLQGW